MEGKLPIPASQIRSVLSSDAETTRRPSGDHAQPSRLVVAGESGEAGSRLPVPDPQRLVGRRGDDAPPVRRPRAAIHAQPVWPERVESAAPDSPSQIRSVPSSDAETMRRPSGDHPQPLTQSVWPERVERHTPDSASQIRSVLSSDAETMRRPSSDHPQPLTQPVVAGERGEAGSRIPVPDPQRRVVRGGDDAPPIWRPRAAIHASRVAGEGGEAGSRLPVPNP